MRAEPQHIWTPRHIYKGLAAEYAATRQALGLGSEPLNVFVTARGAIDLGLRVFQSALVPVLIVTTTSGEAALKRQTVPAARLNCRRQLGNAVTAAVGGARPSSAIRRQSSSSWKAGHA